MPSKLANRYGTLAERQAADRYGLTRDGVHTSWCDAEFQNGKPVEIKSASLSLSDGRTARFRIFEKYHERLLREDGYYCFVAYKPRGRGITVHKMKMKQADALPVSTWYGAGGHRDSQQSEIPVDRIF